MASDINHMLELVETGTIATLTHIDRKDNPHEVTKEQVGLGNADNTSDLDKPVSNATASAITTLRTETNSMINQVNENVGTIVGELNNNIGVITGEINKQILGTQSAVATLRDENEDNHKIIVSAINTFKTATNASIEELKETKQNALIMYDDDLDTLLEEGDYSVAENRCPHFDSPSGSFAGYRRYVQVRALIGNDGTKVFMQAIYNEQYKAAGIFCNPTAVRAYNTANKAWGEWNTNSPMLDLSFTTMAGWKKANYEATDTVLVADQSGGNIKHMPVNTLKSGDHNHDALYLKPATADTKYAPKTHNHDSLYLKPATANTKYAPKTHNHDSLYLKPATANTKYASKTHTHSSLELRPNNIEFLPLGDSAHGGFLDFHYKKSTADYTSRIIEDASGKISVYANNGFFVNGAAINPAPIVTVADGVTWIETPLNNGKSMLYGMAHKTGLGDGNDTNLWKMVPPKSIDNVTVKLTANSLAMNGDIYKEYIVFTVGDLSANSYKNIVVAKENGLWDATNFLLTMQARTR